MVAHRRTQQERSAATRDTVLQATIDCLIERGYAGTTTTAIQARAGLSRGAITHQFGSKHDLLIAAVHRLAEVRMSQLTVRVGSAPSDRDERIDWALRLMWRTFESDVFAATVELWNASRTDDELHASLVAAERELGRRQRDQLAELFGPEIAGEAGFETAVSAVIMYMRGVALTNVLRRSARGEVVATARRIFDGVNE